MSTVTKLKPEGGAPDAPPRNVYQAIAAVMAEIAQEGIAKDRKNDTQGYKFRGIDDVYNALSPILARNGLLMLPCVLSRACTERHTKNGGVLFYVTVEVEFTLISAADGSTHTIKTYGEAMDSADKATNKAMSAAYKYAAMQAFCIPTEGDNDADAVTHQLASAEQRAIQHLRSASVDRGVFKSAWESNKDGWREVLDEAAYRRVVAVMKEIAGSFADEPTSTRQAAKPAPLPPPPPSSNAFDIGDDEIPF